MIKTLLQCDLPAPWSTYHPQYLKRLCRQGKFPKPARVGQHLVWGEKAVDEFLVELTEADAA